nr:MAG TPA: hypothetical protein [Caudoviricetes sp.]
MRACCVNGSSLSSLILSPPFCVLFLRINAACAARIYVLKRPGQRRQPPSRAEQLMLSLISCCALILALIC